MSSWEIATCSECGYSGPVGDDNVFKEYDNRMLCATCRVDARLADGDFNDE